MTFLTDSYQFLVFKLPGPEVYTSVYIIICINSLLIIFIDRKYSPLKSHKHFRKLRQMRLSCQLQFVIPVRSVKIDHKELYHQGIIVLCHCGKILLCHCSVILNVFSSYPLRHLPHCMQRSPVMTVFRSASREH